MSQMPASDEILLLSYLSGQCTPEQEQEVKRRLSQEPPLARKLQDLQSTRQALELLPEVDPPEDLTSRTMARVLSAQKTDALLAREELRKRGLARPTFTLREALTAAAAVLVLALVFLPSYRSAQQRNLQNLCASQTGRIGHAIRSYAFDHNGRMPAPRKQVARWLPNGSEPYVSNSSGLFRLIQEEYAEPGIFQCPAMSREDLQIREGLEDFPAARYIHYAYQHMLGQSGSEHSGASLGSAADEKAILADDTPLFEGGRFQRDRLHAQTSQNHSGRGQNVLYLPGNVRWVESPDVGIDGDNIYQASNVYSYEGVETPAGPRDTFLLPAYSRE